MANTKVLPSPREWKERIRWLGPGIIWLAAGAGGAGELLFPPRVGSLYGYVFLWILVLSIFLKWVIVREIGRWAVCTGSTFMDGLQKLDNRWQWPIWLIMVPQLFIGSSSVAGLGGTAATALILFFGGKVLLWMIVAVVVSTTLLLIGGYKVIEHIATIVTVILALAAIVTAVSVFPAGDKIIKGLVPSIPADTDYQEILPWLSYVLAGSAGMIWYSYWLPAKGYGVVNDDKAEAVPLDSREGKQHLKGWVKQMTLDISLGIVAGTVIVVAFLILGAELLGPQKIVPEENKVAETLGNMLEGVWGKVGYWFMVIGVFAGFWGTVLTNQDGWGRMLANGVKILFPKVRQRWVKDEAFLKKISIVVILAIVPILMYSIAGEPVILLQVGGIVQVIFIPFVAGFVLRMNCMFLPEELRPSKLSAILIHTASIFFSCCIVVYFLQLWGIIEG